MIRAKVSEREDLKWLEEYCNMPLRDVRTPSDSRKSVRRENRHSLISYVALARATEAGERLKSGRLARSRSISSTELTPGTCLGHNDVGDPPGPGLHCLTRQSQDKGAPGPRAPQALRPRECPGAQDHPDRTYMPGGDLIDSIPVC
ncbi:hypothetical protein ALC56_02636 [Trachymyrmex septentrionalis]|uniref:Uncharacterized protein n=1 Tax=Trachymyrmex septentrionalis TaxID=34720 RepID=A0A195FSF6_9HYME|nr:hypothetical protein ALC56_02636 [Trachymyrmex septentrionalis]